MKSPSRREFLQTGVAGALGLAAGDMTSAVAQSDPPRAAVIDTHTHFYDPTRKEGVPWPGKGDATLYKPTLPEHFRKVAAPHGVTGTVVVEASPWLEDNQWLLDLAAKDPYVVGVVGNLTPGGEKFAEHLKRFCKNPRYVGFRINGGLLTKGLDDPQFVADLKLVVDQGRQLDVNGGPAMLTDVARLAAKLPELRIVINHVANVRNDGKTVDADWLKGMQACAAGKNVFCKVSALAEGASKKDDKGVAPKDPAYYVPLLDAVWNTWGEDRVVYGSNWPVCARAADYADVMRVVREFFAGKGQGPAEKFFASNARSAYRWPAA